MHSLAQQDYSLLRQTEVFVADAASTDGTQEIAGSFAPALNIHVIPGGMPSVGRNRGAAASRSRYILFVDADVDLRDRTLLRRTVERMQRRQLHCLTVNIECTDGSLMDRALYRGNNAMQRLSTWFMPFGTGMFLLFERKRFEELHGFQEDAVFAEDFLLTQQVSTLRFEVFPGSIHTSNRRFMRTGHLRMVRLFFSTIIHCRKRSHYTQDHGYWKEAANSGH